MAVNWWGVELHFVFFVGLHGSTTKYYKRCAVISGLGFEPSIITAEKQSGFNAPIPMSKIHAPLLLIGTEMAYSQFLER